MHVRDRRNFILGSAAAMAAAVMPGQAVMAQLMGDQSTLRIVVPFSAAGPTDFIARLFAQALAQELKSTVIVENKPGASGNIGTQFVVDGPADGTMLVHTTAAMQAVNPILYPNQRFDPAKDLIPVGITGSLANMLVVHPESGVKTIEELVEKGKKTELTFATFGPGTSPHIYGELLRKLTGIKAMPIAYKGSGNAKADMLAGRIDFMFDSMTTAVTTVEGGQLLGLAITSQERSPLLPNVPTLKEKGYGGLNLNFWFVLQVPAKTPPEVVQRLRTAVAKAAQDPAYRKGVAERGVDTFTVPADQVERFVREDTEVWRKAVVQMGIKAE
ncbi:Bug family tripartite tricarboxylate transporter substrate binding protein [Bordetella petrii]|uniref:Bug family tripartite tricarboxylate transporter substrate binding protein n=1 Tax=Bordetella petrii TaxID=94624 RepID=UPI001E3C75A8|nr:tripartite tricarboxylate transporter substrate binding protein [Bordetella petrii]MCD0503405.1 tripartite tricarboxylate transporter substrate binding protein [Bordetella petrii]